MPTDMHVYGEHGVGHGSFHFVPTATERISCQRKKGASLHLVHLQSNTGVDRSGRVSYGERGKRTDITASAGSYMPQRTFSPHESNKV